MLAGILFFFAAPAGAAPLDLAVELFAEGGWTPCRRECRRVLVEEPEHEQALLLEAAAALRAGDGSERAGETLSRLAASAGALDVRTMAAYELECARKARAPGGGLGAKPGQWVVALYRHMVRPAIGARCSLEPSCSEYFFQASRKHGLLGFPLIADRLVREPSVVAAAEHPVHVRPGTQYADPVSDHDFWMRREE
ncbi:MAG: membrane protein insertion efficiency factor YidD [Kiritimatiellae bacterium]|nr:membrane protein insertion efficiency factor YidD [Kiritimatiellia bacterium]